MMSLSAVAYAAYNIALNLVANFMTDPLKKGFTKVKRLFPQYRPQYRYFKELEKDLKKMEFVYPGLNVDELPNYIELDDIKQADLHKVTIQATSNYEEPERVKLYPVQNLNDRKILIVGDAGVGKSTFIKNIILDNLHSRYNKYISFKKLFPIFIPLKVIENRSRSPVLKYLFEETPYFQNKVGKERFKKLIKNGKLFFVLDGYDELGSPEEENWAKYEINLFISDNLEKSDIDRKLINDQFLSFYLDISNCKTWISTRENFYNLNQLRNLENAQNQESYSRYSKSVRLLGLDKKRGDFVDFIFSHYKNEKLKKFLNVTLFLDTIDKTRDEQLHKISKTPLFLIIMCGVYIKEINATQIIPQDWKLTIQGLVFQCVDILLIEKDKEKIPISKPAKKIEFHNRRSKFFEEKKLFLYYISWELIIENVPSFDEVYLLEKAKTFFPQLSNSQNSKDILEDLNDLNSSNSNIVSQIINSDVFTQVNLFNTKRILYDFPHRRFREILAIFYLETDENFKHFLKQILNPNLSEFIIILFTTKKDKRNEIVKVIFKHFTNTNNYLYANLLLYKCLNENKDFNVTSALEEEVKLWVLENQHVKLSSNIIPLAKFTSDFIQWQIRKLKEPTPNYLSSKAFLYSLIIFSKDLIVESLMVKELINILRHENFCLENLLVAKFYFSYKKEHVKNTFQLPHYADSISIKGVKDKYAKSNITSTKIFSIPEKKAIILNNDLRNLLNNIVDELWNDQELLDSLQLNEIKELLLTANIRENTFRRIFKEEVFLILSTEEVEKFKNSYSSLGFDIQYRMINLLFPVDELTFTELSLQQLIILYLGYFLANEVIEFSKDDKFFDVIDKHLKDGTIEDIFFVISIVRESNLTLHNWLNTNSTLYSNFGDILDIIIEKNFNDLNSLNFVVYTNKFLSTFSSLPKKNRIGLIRFHKTLTEAKFNTLRAKIVAIQKYDRRAFSKFIFELPLSE